MEDTTEGTKEPATVFKLPVMVGKVGKLPKKFKTPLEPKTDETESVAEPEKSAKVEKKSHLPPAVLLKELSTPIPYKEPSWSGVPESGDYHLEVLKSGCIVDNIDLTGKPFYVFGRLANCDIVMAHPTISRHHAIIQYKAVETENHKDTGYFLYDLGSKHKTFLNKKCIEPNTYIKLKVGHIIKLGCSTRNYILCGPEDQQEQDNDMTITQQKEIAARLKKEREEKIRAAVHAKEMELAEKEKKREEIGATWGMADDAEEEADLSVNPFASTNNEELYLADPKKTLRGYFEREGLELVYDCEERGVGQFLCRVELPIDDASGKPLMAEVLHKGKKKEAVVQCALEACSILDRHGLLRQSSHESRKRKERDWSAEDFYDSDDDNFLDRTGSIEKKRQLRMNRYGGTTSNAASEAKNDKTLTYDDLLKTCSDLEKEIKVEETRLQSLRQTNKHSSQGDTQEDSLDSFMSELKKGTQSMSAKADISNAKMRLQKLRTELAKNQRLAEIAKPANLPELIKVDAGPAATTIKKPYVRSENSILIGKRLQVKSVRKPRLEKPISTSNDVEEFDSDDETQNETQTEPNRLTTEEKTSKNASQEDDTKDIQSQGESTESKSDIDDSQSSGSAEKSKKVFGPMRPPDDYVVPENYFDAETDRDLPEIIEKDD